MTEGNADGAGPFVTALVDEIMHQARRASQLREGERLDPPLAMVLDEPANTAAMPNMPTYMSDSGGRGITLTLAPQGWSQMQRRWGTDGAKEIWNSATLALVMGGSKETQFLEDISRLAGEYDRDKVSTTRGDGHRSRQTLPADRTGLQGRRSAADPRRACPDAVPTAARRGGAAAHLVQRQPGRHAPRRHGRGPRRPPVVTGTPPLDRRVTEVEKNLGQLVDLVGTLTTGVQALQAKVDGAPAKTEPGPSRWAWQHATADQAAWLWAGLGPWVRWLTDRYPTQLRELPPCWHIHGDAVEELTALWASWMSAYHGPDQPRDDMIYWHDRWFPAATGRLLGPVRHADQLRESQAAPRTEPRRGTTPPFRRHRHVHP